MLVITVPTVDHYDENTTELYTLEGFTIELEHSLASISKWEQFSEKPFLTSENKTEEETLSYIQAMCLGVIPPVKDLKRLTSADMYEINKYINAKMSATWFNEQPEAGRGREIITSELIYYYMTVFNIPFECDKWHFNRLLTLIKVANAKNAPTKKVGRREMAARRRQMNEARLRQYGTRG